MPGLGGVARPVNLAALLDHLGLEPFQIEIQMLQHMVLQIAARVAQLIELGQLGDGGGPLAGKPALRFFKARCKAASRRATLALL